MRKILLALAVLLAPCLSHADNGFPINNWGLPNGAWSAANTVTVTTTSTLELAANPSRAFLQVQNNGTTTIYIRLGSVQTGTEGIAVIAGASWTPVIPPSTSLYMVAASATDSVTIVEGQK